MRGRGVGAENGDGEWGQRDGAGRGDRVWDGVWERGTGTEDGDGEWGRVMGRGRMKDGARCGLSADTGRCSSAAPPHSPPPRPAFLPCASPAENYGGGLGGGRSHSAVCSPRDGAGWGGGRLHGHAMHAYTRTHMYVHAHTCIRLHTHTHTHIHVCTRNAPPLQNPRCKPNPGAPHRLLPVPPRSAPARPRTAPAAPYDDLRAEGAAPPRAERGGLEEVG